MRIPIDLHNGKMEAIDLTGSTLCSGEKREISDRLDAVLGGERGKADMTECTV